MSIDSFFASWNEILKLITFDWNKKKPEAIYLTFFENWNNFLWFPTDSAICHLSFDGQILTLYKLFILFSRNLTKCFKNWNVYFRFISCIIEIICSLILIWICKYVFCFVWSSFLEFLSFIFPLFPIRFHSNLNHFYLSALIQHHR